MSRNNGLLAMCGWSRSKAQWRLEPIACALVFLGAPVSAIAQGAAPAEVSASAQTKMSEATQGVATLPEVSVSTDRDAGVYHRESTRGATRTNTPIREIPQSISVVPQEVIEDTGENSIYGALATSGIANSTTFVGAFVSFNMRGFTSTNFYRNGMRQQTFAGGTPDSVGLDSIDVIRGPASLTFGSSDPGGTFNMVSKSPLDYAAYDFGLTLDSHGGRRGTVDLTGPIGSSGKLLYRLNAAVEDSDTFRDHVHINREYLAPRLAWHVVPGTKLMLDVDYTHVKTPMERGIPIFPNQLYGWPSVSTYHGDPATGRLPNKDTTTQLRLEQALPRDWQLDVGLQRSVGSLHGGGLQTQSLLADRRTTTRQYTYRRNHWNNNEAQVYVHGNLTLAGMEHQLLLGAEYLQTFVGIRQRSSNVRDYPYPVDIYDPVFGITLPPDSALFDRTNRATDTHNRALVAQDQIRITPRLHALAGVRYDKYRLVTYNYAKGTESPASEHALTPTLGLTYAFTDALSGYITHARSFTPNTSYDVNGDTLKPERGTSWEAGIKADLLDKRLEMTAALFNIVKSNVATADPDHADFSIAAGKVRSRGVDVSLSGRLDHNTRIVGYAAWQDAKVLEDSKLVRGAPLALIPKTRFNLMAFHRFTGTLNALELGAGVQYQGVRYTNSTAKALRLASYTTLDLMANYRITRNMTLKASVKNVFNRKYIDFIHHSQGYPGLPRTFQATLNFEM